MDAASRQEVDIIKDETIRKLEQQIVAMKALIVEALCSQALADHLGDVRDAEEHLWAALGANLRAWHGDYDSAWERTCYLLGLHKIPLPEHLRDTDDA